METKIIFGCISLKLMNKIVISAVAICTFFTACQKNEKSSTKEEISIIQNDSSTGNSTLIAFGSCNNQSRPQPLWSSIRQNHPNLFIWLGDNIYGDTHDMEVMKAKYDRQKQNEDYQHLLSEMPVIGIWDDHDFGINNGGKHYAKKQESKDLMLRFLNEPRDSPRWDHEGAYTSYTLGEDDQMVKVILLDTRYFRDTVISNKNLPLGNQLNEDGTILGTKQWHWLENELKQSKAAINIIGSSIQVIPEEHLYEKWANFPNERARLFQLIVDTKAKGVIFISGDRHMAEISKLAFTGLDYPLYDITSSGLTHTWGQDRPEANQHRIGEKVIALNFGLIKIDWKDSGPSVTFAINGENNQQHLMATQQY